jgi:Ca2+-transporting ATPase
MNLPYQIDQRTHHAWARILLAFKSFLRIEGPQRAAAFAYYSFFSLFPLIILLVTIASFFIDRDKAGAEVIAFVKSYVPITGEMQQFISGAIGGVVKIRGKAGVIAFGTLVWSSMQFFSTLVHATNLVWGSESYNWWRLPLKSLILLGIMVSALLLGLAVPVVGHMAQKWLFPVNDFHSWLSGVGSFAILFLMAYFNLALLYKLAPRRTTRFSEVWAAALCVTALLMAAESLFVIYLKNFAKFNAVYGTFGGILALLLWIYLSGCIFIFGACLCAAQAEEIPPPADVRVIRKPDSGWSRFSHPKGGHPPVASAAVVNDVSGQRIAGDNSNPEN